MDLFIMKRYVEGDRNTDILKQEDHLSSSLLTKIEKRKKQREKVHQSVEETSATVACEEELKSTGVSETVEKKESRKRKCVSGNSEIRPHVEKNATSTPGEEPVQKKKRKKKKKVKELYDTSMTNETENIENKESASNEKYLETSGFTVIGTEKFSRKTKVKSVLPYWLAKPTVVSRSMKQLSKTIYDIPSLDKQLIKQLEKNNVEHFFPVQSQVIPWLLEAHRKPIQYRPQDVCISAPTGSGKTLAFVLPIIQALKSRVMRHIRALVVLPVKDLALQIYEVFKEYSKGTDLKVILLTGQKSFTSEQQELVKKSIIIGQYNAVDIVVTTPGRLVDHITGTPGFSLKYLRFLVIDEADRVIDNFQNDWLYHIEKHIHGDIAGKNTTLNCSTLQTAFPPPQKLLFSATLTQDPEKLEQLGLFQPKLFTTVVGKKISGVEGPQVEFRGDFIGKYTTPAELLEKCCVMNSEHKPLILFHLINSKNWKNVLCFTSSQENTYRLALLLRHLGGGTLKVGEISAANRKHERDRILHKFSSGKLRVLVSTDALARGIDIPDVQYVVSYDMPSYVKTYIHRIGRTGRAGRKGTAVTFLINKEVKKFKDMLQTAGRTDGVEEFSVSESDLGYLEDDYRNALQALREDLHKKKVRQTRNTQQLKKYHPVKVLKTKHRKEMSKTQNRK